MGQAGHLLGGVTEVRILLLPALLNIFVGSHCYGTIIYIIQLNYMLFGRSHVYLEQEINITIIIHFYNK